MRNRLTWLFLLCLGLGCSGLSAAPYSWKVAGYDVAEPSAAAACEAARVLADRNSSWQFVEAHVARLNGAEGFCYVKYVDRNNPNNVRECSDCDNWRLFRSGDSCPADTEYNKETGECKENKCKILQGSLYEKGGHQAPIPRFINYLGCEIAVSAIDGCIGPAEGETGGTFCRVIGSFTGNWFTSNGSCAFGCDVGPGDGPPPGGDGGTGGDGGSNPPGGDGGSDGGTKPGGGNPPDGNGDGDGNSGGDGDGSGSDGGAGSDGGDGSGGGGLKEPKQGSFDKTIKEYDDAIAKAQKDFQELQGKFESVLASKFDIHLGTGGGSLPCWDFTALGQRFDVCLTEYAKELSVIRYVVLFIAAILAGWIVFYRS